MKTILPLALVPTVFAFPAKYASDFDSGCAGTGIKCGKRWCGACYAVNLGQPPQPEAAAPMVTDALSMPTQSPDRACIITEEFRASVECGIPGLWRRCTLL